MAISVRCVILLSLGLIGARAFAAPPQMTPPGAPGSSVPVPLVASPAPLHVFKIYNVATVALIGWRARLDASKPWSDNMLPQPIPARTQMNLVWGKVNVPCMMEVEARLADGQTYVMKGDACSETGRWYTGLKPASKPAPAAPPSSLPKP